MYEVKNFLDNSNVKELETGGPFRVLEYKRDYSVRPQDAIVAYYAQMMHVRKRQLHCDLSLGAVTVQAGAMQWMAGDVKCSTGVKGAGDLIGKAFRASVTNESIVKPEYTGDGDMVLEPTYKHLLIENLDDWGGSLVIEDGMFMASQSTVKHSAVARSNASSAIFGGEGLFNLCLKGKGYVCLESSIPRGELVEINLENDVIKIDGNMAVAWSGSLQFTVEKSTKSLIGSATSGEGLVNAYRGTGKILFAPVQSGGYPMSPMGMMGTV